MPEAAKATDSAEPVLRLRGIGRRFGGLDAVREVDLEVRPRERRAILGPNGAGKTTLFNLISGEFPPTSGTVELFGSDVTTEPARRRARMGLSRTFQTSRLFRDLTVEDNVYLAVLGVGDGHLRPVLSRADSEMRERAREVATEMGLGEALSNQEFEAAYGPITLDENRNAISNNYVKRVVPDKDGDAVPEVETFWRIPDVDQAFGGTFTADTPPPDRSNPPCEQRDIPWVGNAEEVSFSEGGQAAQKE